MSEINYQALRIAAENATPGEWCTDDYGVIADAGLNANYYIASCSGPDNRANKRFMAAANPATVLALLDELEAAEKRITELEAREILLPERSSMLHRTDFHEDYHTVMAYKVSDVIATIRAAGIRIKGE
ncbi:ead/Ea22-like family protein [Salmonella enterica subsp. enterica serovar Newport]|uniref:Ead/Ea22-like family protein n=1 Tax=Salmonella enterica I TaxID=59201 RepID=A0A3V2NYZ7_SALET|nr:ead/Ea22-like family protein [Salmonella enterica subsp. enterica serovar Newport]EBX1067467.1 ead/Ea22-like family protein [Salmonella enterica subsp. enterica serovar Oranienburg]EDG5334237.1 ead/Ea22-like family protein [Salmonella enterica subsp. enterica serovar Bovismorbificans]EEC4937705.1 ead/Ea22-like family protein [Salmonella enterica subsp. enterica serovar Kasenyi]EBR9097421.1 ead/Ea22-like family protein [Salmonella enterica subsp. enterica serovar Newport]